MRSVLPHCANQDLDASDFSSYCIIGSHIFDIWRRSIRLKCFQGNSILSLIDAHRSSFPSFLHPFRLALPYLANLD